MAFIEASGVDKSYVMGMTRLPVLHGLTLSVERGAMVAIVGASGVGKSTLLHVLGGLWEKTQSRRTVPTLSSPMPAS